MGVGTDCAVQLYVRDRLVATAEGESSRPAAWYLLPDGTALRALTYASVRRDDLTLGFDVQVDVNCVLPLGPSSTQHVQAASPAGRPAHRGSFVRADRDGHG